MTLITSVASEPLRHVNEMLVINMSNNSGHRRATQCFGFCLGVFFFADWDCFYVHLSPVGLQGGWCSLLNVPGFCLILLGVIGLTAPASSSCAQVVQSAAACWLEQSENTDLIKICHTASEYRALHTLLTALFFIIRSMRKFSRGAGMQEHDKNALCFEVEWH